MNESQEHDEFYAYLRTQFTTLEEAKLFLWRWVNEWDQELPTKEFGSFSSRALCAHCSTILENKDKVPSVGIFTAYYQTQYGGDLYWAMWGPREGF